MKIIVAALIAALALNTSSAQLNTVKLDSLFSRLESSNQAMGSVAILKNGRLLYAKSVGDRLVDGNRRLAATTETRYRIGSISKMFTAVIIFQLIEENKLTLDTKLSQFFPTVPNADKILISHLLGHRSGIHNFTDDDNYLQLSTQARTQAQMVEWISNSKPEFEPGSKAAYSNSNYVLLGYIIEKVTGKSYATNLERRIQSKIGLPNTAVGGKTNPEKNESFSYRFAGKWAQEPETDMSVPGGAGAVISTPSDLVKFSDALFANKLVSAKSLASMKEMKDDYGMAMFRFPFYEKKAYGHTGGIDGFSSILCYFPSDSLSVAYIANGEVYPLNDILIGVLSIYFNKPYTIPDFRTVSVVISDQDLDRLAGVYSSSQIPLKITISRQEHQLMAQATGQSSFPLEATGSNKFRFQQAGVEMEFTPEKKELLLKQGGGSFVFTKEN